MTSLGAKLSHSKGADDVPLLEETVGQLFGRIARTFPDQEALVVPFQGYRASYRELWNEVTAVAKGLLAFGIERGDRVALWSPNRYEWVVIQLAVARIGAILVNVNPAYRAAELEYALTHSGSRILLMARGFRGSDYSSIVREIYSRCPRLFSALVIDDAWPRIFAAGKEISDNVLSERELSLDFRDAVNIQYTSGTTGSPKGATLSHYNLTNNGFFVGKCLGYSKDDRICIPVPFYHCFGMVLGTIAGIAHGACLCLPSENFDPLAVLRMVQDEACTSLYGVPTMFVDVLGHPRFGEFDLSTLRTGILAGAPCHEELMRQVIEKMHMGGVTIGYGMTETSPISTQTHPSDPLALRVTTVGRVQPHVEIKIVDPATGECVLRGTRGEICSRGYLLMLGYWENSEATQLAIDRDGWMHTGDLGSMDAEGYVRIEGRIKDMIIRGGENIYPGEIEAFLLTHPSVGDAYVVGVPSARYGEEVFAWIRVGPGQQVTTEELIAFCRDRISAFKIPRHWKLTNEFPMTVTGKVQKFRLRDLAEKSLR